jgi:hypothetical protein
VPNHTYCTPEDVNQTPPTRRWAYPFSILHVTNSEIGFYGPNQVNTQAFMAIAQNFVWFHKTKGGSYDVGHGQDPEGRRGQMRPKDRRALVGDRAAVPAGAGRQRQLQPGAARAHRLRLAPLAASRLRLRLLRGRLATGPARRHR